ncbi:ferritin-like domain-containing protein [Hymenobacter busanensis]|uniref:Ferritin-like domain-containing protein n=1 Tax=Hymenobacter busanensis TaxID=2607656 RepID=A0A7L5A170_9BACT|nr:ferritin-like domain-containing protein [Hymenobacter busanensis]KAA9338545.1 ferritin-like domain-containing protein [Hymenobacter busanensis]QHJ09027.1 hypothetical protein GUY19_17750 [Hymenobacter busanensis]
MNFLTFLDALGEADTPGTLPRRATLHQLGRAAAAALPLAVGTALATPAVAQRAGTPLDFLLLALRLEWLEREFYTRATSASANLPGLSADLQVLKGHETLHATKLEGFVRASGGTVPAQPNYDFTAGGGDPTKAIFATDVFTNPVTFLSVAQVLEDAGVRAYKALFSTFITDRTILDVLVRIHTVEARHAAHIRKLRNQKAWVSKLDGGGPVPGKTDFVYAGEDNVKQPTTATATLDITTLDAYKDAAKLAPVTEAFDEAFASTSVQQLLGLFTY